MSKSEETRTVTLHLTEREFVLHVEAARKAKMTPSEYAKTLMARARLGITDDGSAAPPAPLVSIGGVSDENVVALVEAIRFAIPYASNDLFRRQQRVDRLLRMQEDGADAIDKLRALAHSLGVEEGTDLVLWVHNFIVRTLAKPSTVAEPLPIRIAVEAPQVAAEPSQHVRKSAKALRAAGQTPAEIARSLGVSRETVRKVLFAA